MIHFTPDPVQPNPTQPSGIHFVPDGPEQKLWDAYNSVKGFVTNPEGPVQPVVGAARDVYSMASSPIKALGNFINTGNQQLGNALSYGLGNPKNPNPMPAPMQAVGKAYGAVAPLLNPVPTNDIGMALAPFMAAEGAAAAGKRIAPIVSDIGNIGKGITSEGFGQKSIEGITAGLDKLRQPSTLESVAGQALSAANRLKPNQISAVIANPEILSDATPGTRAVSDMYQDAFKKAGMVIDDARMKFLTGSNWPLRDNEVSKAQKIVDMAVDRAKSGTISDSEAFVARTAAEKIENSVVAAGSPAFRATASKYVNQFDDMLENSSLPNIRQLNRLWFMAKTKEAFQQIMPLNKQGTPNALSSLLMMNQFKKAGEQALEGSPLKAASSAISGSLFSPKMTGNYIQGANAIKDNSAAAAQILTNMLSKSNE